MILVNAERARNPGEGSARGRPEPPPNDPTPLQAILYLLKTYLFPSLRLSFPNPLPFLYCRGGLSSSLAVLRRPREGSVGGVGNSNSVRVLSAASPPLGSAGCVLWVEERTDGPAPFLPLIMPRSPGPLPLQPPAAVGRWEGRGGWTGTLHPAWVRTPKAEGEGGRMAGGWCCVFLGVFFSQANP